MDQIKVLGFDIGKEPAVWTLRNDLRALQEAVGGYIETVTMNEGTVLVCDEEGLLKDYGLNRVVRSVPIRGRFFITGANDEGEFIDLTEEQIRALTEESREWPDMHLIHVQNWIQDSERHPPAYGLYRVIKRTYGGKTEQDNLLWNGSYWVTHGHSPCRSVVAWLEEEEIEKEAQTT